MAGATTGDAFDARGRKIGALLAACFDLSRLPRSDKSQSGASVPSADPVPMRT